MRQNKIETEIPTFSPNRALGSNIDQYLASSHNNHKHSSSSLNKYTKSPYMKSNTQKNVENLQGFSLPKKSANNYPIGASQQNSRVKQYQNDQFDRQNQNVSPFKLSSLGNDNKSHQRSQSNMGLSSEPKQKRMKFKLPKLDMELVRSDKSQKPVNNSMSATLDATNKKKKLLPLSHPFKSQVAVKTKAGTNGNQIKTNQDIAIVQTNFPHSVKLYCVCDGHGLNGHLVSAFIKHSLIKNLNTLLKKTVGEPEKIQLIFQESLARTNDALLNSDINTELSGSTVIAVFLHKNTIYSYNVGDSRAILITQNGENNWQVIALSQDQKPSREDEKQRILKFGGRVEAQTNQKGQVLGPLRVWMKDVQMPGLAMTRSFGDKAGIKAGTTGEPELKTHAISCEDKYIVLASDGVWQYLQNQQIMNIVTPFYKKHDIDLAAQKVVQISAQIWHKISYSRDDITVIIVTLNPHRINHNDEHKDKAYMSLKHQQIR